MNTYELEYRNPGLEDTGCSVQELEKGVAEHAEQCASLSARLRKSACFEYLLDNMRIGSPGADDLFPALGIWGSKPIDKLPWKGCAAMQPAVETMDRLMASGDIRGFYFDYCHSVPEWAVILEYGFGGLLRRVENAQEVYFRKNPDSTEKRDFFQSVIRAYRAVQRLLLRLADAEENVGAGQTAAAVRKVAAGKPETFHEAFLTIWLYYQLSEYADCLQTRCFGNLDQLLYPYYLQERAAGVPEEYFRKVIHNFMDKISSMHYSVGHPMTLGGTNADGTTAVNELSRLFLDEYDRMGFYDPKTHIKVNLNTPDDFLNKALDMVRRNHNSLVFIGEPCIRRSMLKAGYSEEEARTAVIKGCYEYTAAESAVETAPTTYVLPQIVVNTLREYPDEADFESFLEKVEARVASICEETIEAINLTEPFLDERNPVLMLSGVSKRALELGVDGYAKSPLHAHTNIWLAGPATAGDALAAIRRFVFQERKVTGRELLQALDADWKGYEKLRGEILNSPEKFGNNNRQADELLKRFLEMFTSRINMRPNSRGGFYTTALHSAEQFYICGCNMGATPDGRRAGEEISKNISPQPGSCRNGVTAMMLSALSLDSSEFMGDFPLDVALHPSAVRGRDGLDAMRTLVKTYVKGFGHAVHFNVFSVQQLLDAQKNPEKYSDLQIRVCGWNVLWNNLSPAEQKAYIMQAE